MPIPNYHIHFDGESAADDVFENMIRLEIEEDVRKAASFMFRLSIALQDDGQWSHLDDERLSLFKKVTISIGFGGDSTPVLVGCITHAAPHFDPEEELCYLEVRGMDFTCLMGLEEKIVTWTNQSHSDIASAIFDAYGITAEVEDAPTLHPEDGAALVQRGADITFLRELARKNGFDCYVSTNADGEVKGFFKPRALDASPLPPLAVHFEGETNVQFIDVQAAGNHPLSVGGWHLSLTDKSLERFEKTEYEQTIIGKESLPGIVRDRIDALTSPVEAASRSLPDDFVSLDGTELERTLQSRRNRHGWFVRARGVVNAESYNEVIRARRLIPVKGMGTRYSGNYLVASVKHVIADGHYEQHIELIRNAWGVAGDEPFEREA